MTEEQNAIALDSRIADVIRFAKRIELCEYSCASDARMYEAQDNLKNAERALREMIETLVNQAKSNV